MTTFETSFDGLSKLTLLISLVEQSFARHALRLCWLKVTLLQELNQEEGQIDHLLAQDGKNEREENKEESDQNIQTVLTVYLSDPIGKLMASKESEWVDLYAVSLKRFSCLTFKIFLLSLD